MNTNVKCPIYAVGIANRVQVARRADGVWFQRERNLKHLWGPWVECKGRPYEFSAYIDPQAGNARLPNAC